MVEIGGEVRVAGRNADGEKWSIGIEAPTRQIRQLHSIVELEDVAMATSGDYRNYQVHRRATYSHTLDPRTGQPVRHALASVTVLSRQCAEADALATALIVMGPASARRWAQQHEVATLMLMREGERVQAETSPAFTAPVRELNGQREAPTFGTTFVLVLVVFAVALAGMSIGVIVSNRRLKGSCGGLAGLTDERGNTLCDACTNPAPTCSGNPASRFAGQGEPRP